METGNLNSLFRDIKTFINQIRCALKYFLHQKKFEISYLVIDNSLALLKIRNDSQKKY